MPKLKTNKGAAKRFKRTGTGKLKRRRACRAHILTKKPHKRLVGLRQNIAVGKSDKPEMERLLKLK
jgi:large subunit ribosomal protein L35